MFKKLALALCLLGLASGNASATISFETQEKMCNGLKLSARILTPIGMGATLFALYTENKYSLPAAITGCALSFSGALCSIGRAVFEYRLN